MIEITIFTTETCPRCKALEAKLREWGYQPKEKSMVEATTDEIADCRMDSGMGFWPMFAPVLRVEFDDFECWYGDASLFPNGEDLDVNKLKAILGQGKWKN